MNLIHLRGKGLRYLSGGAMLEFRDLKSLFRKLLEDLAKMLDSYVDGNM